MENVQPFPHHVVLTFAGMAVAMGVVPLFLAHLWARFFAPAKPGPEKTANYECGLASSGDPGGQQSVHYYLYAIVFLVFDVESVFLIPFAIGLFGGFYIVPLYALVQSRSAPSHRSRIIAANNILNALFMVVGSLAAAAMLGDGLTIPALFGGFNPRSPPPGSGSPSLRGIRFW